MSNSVQNAKTQYIDINTDFGYDALGGIGKTGRLGSREAEVLPPPSARQSTRIPGPPKTAGRWFSKLLDTLTPASWRAQGKFKRGLEDFSALTGRILGHIFNSAEEGISRTEKENALSSALKELASLRQNAKPMTSRGADYKELLSARMQVNINILEQEHPEFLVRLQEMKKNGTLDEIISSLDPQKQADMIEDLTLMKNCLPNPQPAKSEEVQTSSSEIQTSASAGEKPKTSPFSLSALKQYFLENFTIKGKALKELQASQGQLSRLTDEAKQLLQESLREIQRAGANIEQLDAEELSRIQHGTDENFKKAVQFAMDNVCGLAFRHLDSSETVGTEGKDYARITADFVKAQLDAAEAGSALPETPADLQKKAEPRTDGQTEKTNPFADAVQTAKAQIREISELYGELSDTVSELKNRSEKYACAVFLNDLPTAVQDTDTFTNVHALCSELIKGLQSATFDTKTQHAFSELELLVYSPAIGKETKQELQAMLPKISHALSPDRLPAMHLPETALANRTLSDMEQLKSIHQIIGNAGALLQQSKLPQADMLTAQALQLSRQIFQLQTKNWQNSGQILQKQIQDMQSTLSRFMANSTLAQMQTENPAVRSAQPEAKNIDAETAREGFGLIQRGLRILADKLSPEHGKSVAAATVNNGIYLTEKGIAAAKACARLLENRFNKELDTAKQLAVCLESGRQDADTALQSLLSDKKWNKGKHLEAKTAIQDFLQALAPINAGRRQNELLVFLENRFSGTVVPHDIYRGFDGSFHILINTDRQTVMGDSKKIQGTKWITLPSPESVRTGTISTGSNRLDDLLKIPQNVTGFYPNLHTLLTEYFNGQLYSFRLDDA